MSSHFPVGYLHRFQPLSLFLFFLMFLRFTHMTVLTQLYFLLYLDEVSHFLSKNTVQSGKNQALNLCTSSLPQ